MKNAILFALLVGLSSLLHAKEERCANVTKKILQGMETALLKDSGKRGRVQVRDVSLDSSVGGVERYEAETTLSYIDGSQYANHYAVELRNDKSECVMLSIRNTD